MRRRKLLEGSRGGWEWSGATAQVGEGEGCGNALPTESGMAPHRLLLAEVNTDLATSVSRYRLIVQAKDQCVRIGSWA